jgi:chromosome segregation ATPase
MSNSSPPVEVKIADDHRWKAVRAHIAKGDRAKEKAEQHYISAGQYLIALKAEHTGTWAEWAVLVQEKAGIGKSRASELMQIADGTKTVEGIREATAEKVRQIRARKSSPVRTGENAGEPTAIISKITKELESAQAHNAELETAHERDEDRLARFENELAELADAKALKAKNDALRATLENISKLLSEASALAAHLSQNRNDVLGKMQRAKTAADTALGKVKTRPPKNTEPRRNIKKKRPILIEGTATRLN